MMYCWKKYKLLIIIDNKWLPLLVIFQGSKSVSDMFFFSAQREKLNIRVNTRGDREMVRCDVVISRRLRLAARKIVAL